MIPQLILTILLLAIWLKYGAFVDDKKLKK